jgi:hypothetical protein
MKHFRFLLVLVVLLGAAVAVYASSTIVVKPSDMKSGETKTIVDDGKTIRITRDGDSMKVVVEGAGKSKEITIENDRDGDVRIIRAGDDEVLRIDPTRRGGHRIIINGQPLRDLLDEHVIRPRHADTWFVCPKDHATLRVPEVKEGATFKCPVDGTTMEQRKGRAFSLFFDDEAFDDL